MLKNGYSSLDSYLKHVTLKKLSVDLPVVRGTVYEFLTKDLLSRVEGIQNVCRVGQANDGGVDLTADIMAPLSTSQAKLFVQCKTNSASVSSSLIREMEGVHAHRSGYGIEDRDCIMLICARSDLSSRAKSHFLQSRVPFLYWKINYVSPVEIGASKRYQVPRAEILRAPQGSLRYNISASKLLNVKQLRANLRES